jgi:hypothetical protein
MNAALRICPGLGFILMLAEEILNAVFICRRKRKEPPATVPRVPSQCVPQFAPGVWGPGSGPQLYICPAIDGL